MVKLTNRRLSDRSVLAARVEAVAALALDAAEVVPPLRIRGEMVQPIGDWWMTATPFVQGGRLAIANPIDADLMGFTLARLHQALEHIPAFAIPPVAALGSFTGGADAPGWQLLHGDFNEQNLIATPEGLPVLDFDECGYGPIEYDVANALYMVLFDAEVSLRPETYEAFRPPFLSGYQRGAGQALDDGVVNGLIEARIKALARWLADLPNAPIGIQASSPEWLETLHAFVRSHGSSAAPIPERMG